MRYYKMAISWEPSIKGIRDGSAQLELDRKLIIDKDAFEKVQTFFTWSRAYARVYPPTFDVKIEGFKLRKKGLLTDFLDYTPSYADCRFMVNDRVLDLFSRFNLSEHYYYPLTIASENGIINNYHLFNMPCLDIDVIDFPNCVFFEGMPLIEELTYFKFDSFEDYRNTSGTPELEKLAFNDKLDKSLDLFESRLGGLMVSERLKNAIQQAGLAGVKIYEGKPGPLVEVLD